MGCWDKKTEERRGGLGRRGRAFILLGGSCCGVGGGVVELIAW